MNRPLTLTWIIPAMLMLAMTACTSAPKRLDSLDEARALVAEVDRDPMAEEVAGAELKQAKEALAMADAALEEREPMVEVHHHAIVAMRHAEIARERIAETRAREQIAASEAERNEVLLSARSREAAQAKLLADAKSAELARTEMEAQVAREEADAALAEARRLEEEMAELKAEQTVRGLVLTLNNGVLFDVDQATLKPGAEITLDRLAAFMNDYPERNLMIEGHTDSTGDDAYNVALSSRRADAVQWALVNRGVAPTRIRTHGLGEDYPVASNDSTAGRQLNRRVEIVLSDQDGLFPAAAQRSVDAR